MHRVLVTVVVATLFTSSATAGTSDPNYCDLNDLTHIGYFDYRDTSPAALERKKLVEGAHFTQSVRRGVAGNSGDLIGDVNYVLHHFPNHPQALLLMANIQSRPGFKRNRSMRRDSYYDTTDCFFKRAIDKVPDDPAVYLVRAIVEHREGKLEAAEQDYRQAISLFPNYAEAHYNLGLLYLEQERLDEARPHAEKAYQLGYPLQGLKRKLEAASTP